MIAANEQNIQTWWDVEPGVKKPTSLEFALAQANGFIGGDAGRIPAMLMPQQLELWGGLELAGVSGRESSANLQCIRSRIFPATGSL